MGYIGAHGIAALHRYKYSGVDDSYLAKYVLQPFWNRFVTFLPLWMPPNMDLCSWLCLHYLDLFIPLAWIHPYQDGFILHTGCFYFYIRFIPPPCQTFDAVEGKQARRTNSSSPLGELFDHRCDALACAFGTMAIGSTAMCGGDSFWFWVISAIPFYGATWEHFILLLPHLVILALTDNSSVLPCWFKQWSSLESEPR